MIVFDLKCGAGHVFEAWFASSDAFEDQKRRGLVACPYCGAADAQKAVMAPNVACKGNQKANQSVALAQDGPGMSPDFRAMMEKVAAVQAEILKKSQWVGSDFVTKARAMDAGEIDPALIHGQASLDQTRELIEDGISVMPLLLPVVPPDKQN